MTDDFFHMPIINRGKSIWPEQFPEEVIQRLRLKVGEFAFMSQMMLEFYDTNSTVFKEEQIVHYDDDIIVHHHNNEILYLLNEEKLHRGGCFWDPSLGKSNSDASVVAFVFVNDETQHYFVHEMFYLDFSSFYSQEDFRNQIRTVILKIKQLKLNHIFVEVNGIGALIPTLMKQVAKDMKFKLYIEPYFSKTSKVMRIFETLEPLITSKSILFHSRVLRTPFIQEFVDFSLAKKDQKDDGLDALTMALKHSLRVLPRFEGRVLFSN
ncbi:MAG: hypothetical protein JJV93_02705 [Alphaproteobacteria bacterium]|nr:hypothetical protein [Alphaproteobacteria bacterium]MBL0718139.1 hypothetical protein [Alphaproteobacteria bacterium]